MQSLKVNLKYCYGITALDDTFDFTSRRQFLVYAPNGVTKSSLAHVFNDISEGKASTDRVFKDRATVRDVVDETNHALNPESVFVVEPYNEAYRSNRVSALQRHI
jgi:wobble nucleotide-excising tRNase